MTPDSVGPFSRPFPLHKVTESPSEVVVEASAEERAALSADLGLVSIAALASQLRVSGGTERVRVVGRVRATVEQTCVVTLDPFTVLIDEAVDVAFAAPNPRSTPETAEEVELDLDHDLPDELTGEVIDLGTITAEFLALGLDPYPRKPGVSFEQPAPVSDVDGPFARLASLRTSRDEA